MREIGRKRALGILVGSLGSMACNPQAPSWQELWNPSTPTPQSRPIHVIKPELTALPHTTFVPGTPEPPRVVVVTATPEPKRFKYTGEFLKDANILLAQAQNNWREYADGGYLRSEQTSREVDKDLVLNLADFYQRFQKELVFQEEINIKGDLVSIGKDATLLKYDLNSQTQRVFAYTRLSSVVLASLDPKNSKKLDRLEDSMYLEGMIEFETPRGIPSLIEIETLSKIRPFVELLDKKKMLPKKWGLTKSDNFEGQSGGDILYFNPKFPLDGISYYVWQKDEKLREQYKYVFKTAYAPYFIESEIYRSFISSFSSYWKNGEDFRNTFLYLNIKEEPIGHIVAAYYSLLAVWFGQEYLKDGIVRPTYDFKEGDILFVNEWDASQKKGVWFRDFEGIPRYGLKHGSIVQVTKNQRYDVWIDDKKRAWTSWIVIPGSFVDRKFVASDKEGLVAQQFLAHLKG